VNPISELTSLLWWLMLLSASALILHDIGVGILPAPRPRPPVITSRGTGTREDELKALERRISRAIQRPSSFRTLQKEIAQSITQLALATHGFTMSRVPESQPEMIYDILPDSDLARFVVDQARSSESTALTRNKMLTELNRTIMILERAEAELK
jgi:hypothetical protein